MNGKLGAAIDAGIEVEISKADAPGKLPLRDADLCSLIMNIIDNAISAALDTPKPFIHLNFYESDYIFTFLCENSTDMTKEKVTEKKRPCKTWFGS